MRRWAKEFWRHLGRAPSPGERHEEQEIGRSGKRRPQKQVLEDEQKSARQPAGAQAGWLLRAARGHQKRREVRLGGPWWGLDFIWRKWGAFKAFLWGSDSFTFLQIFFLGRWLRRLGEVDLKGESGGTVMRLWLYHCEIWGGLNCSHGSWEVTPAKVPGCSEPQALSWFVCLFILIFILYWSIVG